MHGPHIVIGTVYSVLRILTKVASGNPIVLCEGLSSEEIAIRLDLSPYDHEITRGDPALEYFFDLWYRQPITGRDRSLWKTRRHLPSRWRRAG